MVILYRVPVRIRNCIVLLVCFREEESQFTHRSPDRSTASAFLNQVTCGIGSPMTSHGTINGDPYSPSVSLRSGEKNVGGSWTVTVAVDVTVGKPPLRRRTWHIYSPVCVKLADNRVNVRFHGSSNVCKTPEFSIKTPSFSHSVSSSCNGRAFAMHCICETCSPRTIRKFSGWTIISGATSAYGSPDTFKCMNALFSSLPNCVLMARARYDFWSDSSAFRIINWFFSVSAYLMSNFSGCSSSCHVTDGFGIDSIGGKSNMAGWPDSTDARRSVRSSNIPMSEEIKRREKGGRK